MNAEAMRRDTFKAVHAYGGIEHSQEGPFAECLLCELEDVRERLEEARVDMERYVSAEVRGKLEEALAERDAYREAHQAEKEISEQVCGDFRARLDAITEALLPFTRYDLHALQHIAGLTHDGHDLRAIHAEDVDALIGHIATARRVLGIPGSTWTGSAALTPEEPKS